MGILTLMRHGKSMWNLDPSKPDKDWAYAGAVDVPLSESGINVSDTFLNKFSYLLLAFDGFSLCGASWLVTSVCLRVLTGCDKRGDAAKTCGFRPSILLYADARANHGANRHWLFLGMKRFR